ncbi:MAG: sigma-54 dependent transcriptional regulator [Spirosomataceae bacterium]
MPKILVVDDEKNIRDALRDILEYEGYAVEEARDGEEGLNSLKNNEYDVVLCDIKMPKMDGLEMLLKAGENGVGAQFIMISAFGNVENAVEATKRGAFDFITKPPDLNRLLVSVRNALNTKKLVKENTILTKQVYKINDIVGESAPIRKVKDTIERVAPTEARVMITGPNGSGKEMVAKQLHQKSRRAHMQLVEVNCAAIPSELIESELFGHEKGAFTSAIKQRIGKFEQADGGTLFLDEIGDMSLSAQAKVLRALQEGKITRVGGDKEIKINVRVIAATNKDLHKEIDGGNFREDLYHRLNVIPIHVPPLSERREDIPLLINKFLNDVAFEYNQSPKGILSDAMTYMKSLPWTGNVRELRNVIERLVIMCGDEITLEDVEIYAVAVS